MVECGRHLNVDLMTLSQVLSVAGNAGNYTVKVQRSPRYVDMDKCIACGLCAEKCPRPVADEFNEGVNNRKAIYIKYGQSVPLKYAIDPNACIYLTRGKCRACEKFCPTGAINFEDKAEIVELKVGAVVLAPGYQPYDPSGEDYYGYDSIADVVTSLEYERLLSASGPCMGHLMRPSDNREPKRIAWLQCVGSRNTNRCSNGYCSSVCCMYAVKQALVTAEHTEGDELSQTIFFMDLRSHGKEFERYYEDAKAKGVRFIRARPHTIDPLRGGSGVRMRYTTEDGRQMEEDFDLAVLSVGMEASQDNKALADIFDFSLDSYGFAKTAASNPVRVNDGVFVAGALHAPKAIPHAVTEASAAANEAARMLSEAKGALAVEKTYPDERDVADEEPRVGVFVCSCGINIAGVIDVNAVVEYAKGLDHVAFVENNLFTCSADTQELIRQKAEEMNLNRIVVAACTPRTHEPLFQETLKEAGLNAYLVEMANIRNQNSWVHQKEPEKATEKAKDQVRMAVAKAVRNKALTRLKVDVNQKALVIGGGVAGMTTALSLAEQGFPVALLEREDRLGGNARHVSATDFGDSVPPMLKDMIKKVEGHPDIRVHTNARLKTAVGSVGNFVSKFESNGETRAVTYGAAVIATGAKESIPDEYGFGSDPRIHTHLSFDKLMQEEVSTVQKADTVAFIQCVGSRDFRRPYCSRICCTHTMKAAIKLKTLNRAMQVVVFYRDIRTYGLREELYRKARELGVLFVRYSPDDKPQVRTTPEGVMVRGLDPISRFTLELEADYLVLAAAVEPHGNEELVELYKCGANADGFLNEAHPKLRPVDMSVDGLFVAGLCNYPKPMDEAISQAQAAAARAAVVLSRKEMLLDAIKSYVTEHCDGCALCVDVCPYRAIRLQESTGEDGRMHRMIQVDPALCKGCGVCAATCPKDGVRVHGFTKDQIKAQVASALESLSEGRA